MERTDTRIDPGLESLARGKLANRGAERFKGLILLIAGVFVLLDSPYLFPIPIIGFPSVMLSCIILFFSIKKLRFSLGVPRRAALEFIASRGGKVSIEELRDFLEDEAEVLEVIENLEQGDLAILDIHDIERVEAEEVEENCFRISRQGLTYLGIDRFLE